MQAPKRYLTGNLFTGTGFLVVFSIAIVFCSALFVHASDSGQDRYRVFSLNHIPARIAREILSDADIGTVSQLPGANTLLVTASREDLIKATSILSLIDTQERYVFNRELPSDFYLGPDQLRDYMRGVSIGTFSEPPRGDRPRIIVDIHGESLAVLAPEHMAEQIIRAIARVHKAGDDEPVAKADEDEIPEQAAAQIEAAAEQPAEEPKEPEEPEESLAQAEPDDEVDVDEDEFFDNLLSQLARAETDVARARAQEQAEQPEEPIAADDSTKQPDDKDKEIVDIAEIEQIIAELQAPEDISAEQKEQEQEILKRLAAQKEDLQAIEEAETEIVMDITPDPDAKDSKTLQTSYRPELEADVDEQLRLRLPEEIQIVDLISLVGEYFDIDYMYDPREISGSVRLNMRGPIKVRELYPLLESALKFRGFVMTRQGGVVVVVPQGKVLDVDPAILTDGDAAEFGDVTITRVFNLSYISAQDAQNFLQTMRVSENINASVSDAGTLIVTGYAFRMPRIEQLLNIIDVPGRPRQFRQRTLRYTLAENLTPRIERLAAQLETVSVHVQAPEAAADPRQRAPQPRQARDSNQGRADAVFLDADERTNRILMIGTAEKLDIVESLVDSLDVRKQDLRQIRVYEIVNVTAEDVRDKLTQLGLISATGTAGTAQQRQQQAAQARAQRAASEGSEGGALAVTEEGIAEQPQVVVLETTNSLLVNATNEQHAEIAMIIGYVDNETQREQVPYRLYPLENQDPVTVAETLNQLVQETLRDLEDKIETRVDARESIAIIPDESTFSVIVYASRRNQEWIGDLIAQLDRRRPQVLIDVTLVEIRRAEEFQYDLEVMANLERAVTGNVLSGTSLPFQTTQDRNLEVGWHRGEIRGFYGESRIQMLLQAMQRKGYGRVLAKPQILVNDNEEGRISTVDRRFVRESSVTVPGEGRPVESVRFTPYDATIELGIKPTISEGDLLRLEIELRREDFVGTGAEGAPPDQLTSNVNTIVTVPDQKTIILGGLIRLTQDKRGRKVPILGDIPIIGGLFRSIDNSDDESKLYVFVQAHILRPDERLRGLPELEEISDRLRRSFEESEAQFQKYEQWPGLEPTPMSPERVLEH